MRFAVRSTQDFGSVEILSAACKRRHWCRWHSPDG